MGKQVKRILRRKTKTLVRLCGCADCFEFSQYAHAEAQKRSMFRERVLKTLGRVGIHIFLIFFSGKNII